MSSLAETQHRSPSLSVLSEKLYSLMFLNNPHISIDLISHCLPLMVKQFDCHMRGQVLCRRITASCVGVKCTDFQRIPPSFESACSKLIKCYRSTLESSQESQRFYLFTFAIQGCDSSCSSRQPRVLMLSW